MPSGKFPICVVDLSQGAFMCPIECSGQFVEGMLDTPWEPFAEVNKSLDIGQVRRHWGFVDHRGVSNRKWKGHRS